MFPVLVTLDNRDGLLKPGMNGEVAVLVDQVNDVLAVPNDAVKNVREAAATGQMLGLNVDSVQAEVRAQMQNGFGRMRSDRGGAGDGGRFSAAGEVARQQGETMQQPQQGYAQGGRQQIEVTDEQCTNVKKALAKKPAIQKQLDDLRAKARSGEISDFSVVREESQKLYASVGVDPRVASACRRTEGGANPGMGGGDQRGSFGQRGGSSAASQAPRSGGGLQLATPEVGGAARRARPGLVFVADSAHRTYHPRVVLLGASNFDYTEVVSGVKEGERVALLTSLALQAQRQQQNDRMRQGMGVPGLTPNAGPGRGAGGGGGGPRGR
jgi:HlyD family secretion protein